MGLSRFAFFIAFAIASSAALAQTWPAKPVRLVIGFPPGTPPEDQRIPEGVAPSK